jgi:hypothetical protein
MSTRPVRRHPEEPPKEAPVRPGTPLYRLLELIAREIARDLEGDRPGVADERPEK